MKNSKILLTNLMAEIHKKISNKKRRMNKKALSRKRDLRE